MVTTRDSARYLVACHTGNEKNEEERVNSCVIVIFSFRSRVWRSIADEVAEFARDGGTLERFRNISILFRDLLQLSK